MNGPEPRSHRALNADASALMKRGIVSMESPTPSAALDALRCFDEALALRRQLPIQDVPAYAYGLAACWLNRADALRRIGGSDHLSAALGSYDEAIVVLRVLPLDDDTRYWRRLAIAHQNRGLLLASIQERKSDAVQAFIDALEVLEPRGQAPASPAVPPDYRQLLGAVLLNLAAAQRALATADAADRSGVNVIRALGAVASLEANEELAAEVGLKSRHLICQLMADRLSQTAPGAHSMDDVHAATDAVDGALDLIGAWERRGVLRFRGLAQDFVRFGALVYERYQRQFLDEFLREHAGGFTPASS